MKYRAKLKIGDIRRQVFSVVLIVMDGKTTEKRLKIDIFALRE